MSLIKRNCILNFLVYKLFRCRFVVFSPADFITFENKVVGLDSLRGLFAFALVPEVNPKETRDRRGELLNEFNALATSKRLCGPSE